MGLISKNEMKKMLDQLLQALKEMAEQLQTENKQLKNRVKQQSLTIRYCTEAGWGELYAKDMLNLETECEDLKKIIEEAISQHHRVDSSTIMDGVGRKYEALKENKQ